MTDDMMTKLRRSLIAHEELKTFPYIDTVGKITIGIGYNLSDRGIDLDWINTKFIQDVNYFYSQLSQFPWFTNLNIDRQIVLVDMSFMGLKRLMEFKNMIAALEKSDFETAANEMLNSKWATEVKTRATQLADGMRTGIYNI